QRPHDDDDDGPLRARGRRTAPEERVSDPPLAASALSRFGIGCAITAALGIVGVGALGLLGVSWQRFAAPGIREARDEGSSGSASGSGSATGSGSASGSTG